MWANLEISEILLDTPSGCISTQPFTAMYYILMRAVILTLSSLIEEMHWHNIYTFLRTYKAITDDRNFVCITVDTLV